MNEYGYIPKPVEPKKNSSVMLIIVIALCFSLLGGALGFLLCTWREKKGGAHGTP